MKGFWATWVLMFVTLGVGGAYADPSAPSPIHDRPAKSEVHPCMKLHRVAMEACKSAKFVRGGHGTHMGLYEDCLRPIMEGKSVPSTVSIDPALVTDCKAKRAHQP
jgi:hypothetical protein